jgi:hypothetical protein
MKAYNSIALLESVIFKDVGASRDHFTYRLSRNFKDKESWRKHEKKIIAGRFSDFSLFNDCVQFKQHTG